MIVDQRQKQYFIRQVAASASSLGSDYTEQMDQAVSEVAAGLHGKNDTDYLHGCLSALVLLQGIGPGKPNQNRSRAAAVAIILSNHLRPPGNAPIKEYYGLQPATETLSKAFDQFRFEETESYYRGFAGRMQEALPVLSAETATVRDQILVYSLCFCASLIQAVEASCAGSSGAEERDRKTTRENKSEG